MQIKWSKYPNWEAEIFRLGGKKESKIQLHAAYKKHISNRH